MMKRSIVAAAVLALAAPAALAQTPGGSAAGAESQSAKKPQTGDYYQSNENKADPNLKQEKRKEKAEKEVSGRAPGSGGRCPAG